MNAIRELAADAYVWGSALVGAARLRHNVTRPDDPFARRPLSSAAAPINRLGHQSALSDPELGVGVAPNVDTLYSLAWIDTDQEPFVLETPDFGDRYYSFQIAFADTECAVCPGQRTHGSRLPPLFVHGAEYRGQVPDGMIAVPSRTRYAMIAGRVLVQPEDPDDVERVRSLQAQMRLRSLARWDADDDDANPISAQAPLPTADEVTDHALLFLHQLGVVLGERVTADDERSLVESLTALGIEPDGGFDPDAIAPGDRDMVVAGLDDGRARVDPKIDHLGHRANGWSVNLAGSNFGGDHLLRAAVAQNQIYVVPAEEAVYPVARVDANGDRLDGSRSYQLHLPAPLPAGAFWSLTVYGTPGPLVANELDRYAIGDRSPGLAWGANGSLTIELQHRRPESGPNNWLPVPVGPFHLMMRLYWPDRTVLDGSWDPPPVEPIDTQHTRSTAPQPDPAGDPT